MTPAVSEHIDVAVAPHPFAVERVRHSIPAGLSVAEIVARVQEDPALRRHAHVYLNGDAVPRENWPRVRPKAGTVLSIRMVPMGGGGRKNPLRTVLSLAILAASPMIAGSLVGALGGVAQTSFMGFSLGRAVTMGVNLLGRLALNALAPPGRPRLPGGRESPTLFLQAARNDARPFGRVPRVLGRHRLVPPMGALPYTETAGAEQYLRVLFVWGYGPLDISDLRIGETPLSDFEGVEIETRRGYPGEAPLTLYSDSVLQNDLQVQVKNTDGHITRTSESAADELSVDITFPRGLFRLDAAGRRAATAVEMEVQYSPAGAGTWSAGSTAFSSLSAQSLSGIARPAAYVAGGTTSQTRRIDRIVLDPASGAARLVPGTTLRFGIDAGEAAPPAVPAGMHPVARVERRSDDAAVIPAGRVTDERPAALFGPVFQSGGDFLAASSGSADGISVAAGGLKFPALAVTSSQSAALRKTVSFKVPRGQYDVRVKRLTADASTDDLFDECVWTALRTVRAVYPVHMEGVAVTALRIRATDQLSGVLDRFNGIAQSLLPDWDGSGWTEQATSNPASLYRHVLQGSANARPLADGRIDLARLQAWHAACAAAGREYNAVIDYDVSVRDVLHDVAAAGRASPSLVDGKWAVVEDAAQSVPVQHFTPRNTWGFRGEKAFDDAPHALRARIINRDKGWLQDEILVYDDGYDAETAEKYETLELPGVTSPRQAWKDGRYHIATARLRPESYTFFADIEHIVCTRGDLVRFTHDVPLFGIAAARVKAVAVSGGNTTGVTLDAAVTMETGKSYALRVRKADGTSLVLAIAAAPGTGTSLSFAAPPVTAAGPGAGDLALFGESGQESVALVVKAIEPQNGLSARLTCVDAAPAVHTADTGVIPGFSPQITVPPELRRPPAPVIAGLQSGDGALIRGADGSLAPAILVTLAAPDYTQPLSVDLRLRGAGETEFRPASFSASGGQLTVTGVDTGRRYDLRLVHKNLLGMASAPLIVADYAVEAASGLPGDVADFALNIIGETAHLGWAPVPDADLSHYRIRFSAATSGATWSSAFEVVGRVARSATSVSLPAQVGTWLVKAVDDSGRESLNAASVTSSIDRVEGFTTVQTVDETSSFGGLLPDGCEDVAYAGGDRVVLDGALEGIYVFEEKVDLSDVYTVLMTAAVAVTGDTADNGVDNWGGTDLVERWDGDLDPATWGVQLQVRSTPDDPDPVADPVWSAWRNFVVGEYTGRGFEFRLLLSSTVEGVTPSVSLLEVNVNMRNRAQGEAGLSGASGDSHPGGGTHIVFPEEFYNYTAVTVTPHNMATGDYCTVTNQDWSGFNVKFFNASNARVTRTFDYIAQGYGRKVTI